MSAIVWNRVEDVWYENGLDRGVLYPEDDFGVAWNGLVSVDEKTDNSESFEFFFDGVKRRHTVHPGNFAAHISALTYPDDFLPFDGFGQIEAVSGMFFENQPRNTFHLSYRTRVNGGSEGYKIHILYNLTAEPRDQSQTTLSEDAQPSLFSWAVKSVPMILAGYGPMAHVVLDSRKIYPDKLELIEDALYGTETTIPRIMTPAELAALTTITVVDNEDGTYTITGPDSLVYPGGIGQYLLDIFGLHYLDADTYTISSS